jgi:hypothetical protein
MTARFLIGGLAAATLLAGCVVESNPQPAPSQPAPPLASQPAPPEVGFSPDVTNAAVEACRRELDAQTDGAVEVTGTEFSQANSAVYMVVGANRAPWQCLVSNDGRGAELMFIGNEGGA